MFVTLALIALLVEAAAGYPPALFRAVGHPVTWIGAFLSWCDRNLNRPAWTFAQRRVGGVVTLALMLGATVAISAGLWAALESALPPLAAIVVGGILASSLLAQRCLAEHAEAVADRLEADGIDGGREAVTFLVGRDVSALDEAGVSRAAVESLAENFSDGVVAPLFWLAVGGIPAAAAYKAVNTADSMIGHKSERYHAFGWASARLDDLLNLPGSRLAALWLVLAALLQPSASAENALRAVFRDARRHRSPNAGWPEAAMAGALGFKLGGPRIYGGTLVEDAWMGDGRSALAAEDIRAALRLYRTACLIQANALAVAVVAFTAL
ncbi:adenosylcobinamide-phosphate synthase CbiB [Rhodomicrobium sp. Az07]|uniref:adenosylcobinamide-phosphate synthase CbiB n=1 Tax=Rhodomicrobium sp. Az07 TaxID=2839034 RepID=UPI001BEC1D04|nr:adenosylcobinamide-phosphate synthase CbiB [Rhodomicrobium sp. Az07]MBT3070417.1 adenosylcobinamide-phosphate synthase CbiB [Rhodomicrobium sp. Az07]